MEDFQYDLHRCAPCARPPRPGGVPGQCWHLATARRCSESSRTGPSPAWLQRSPASPPLAPRPAPTTRNPEEPENVRSGVPAAAAGRSRRCTTAAIAGAVLSALMTLLPLSAPADLSPGVLADLYLVQTDDRLGKT